MFKKFLIIFVGFLLVVFSFFLFVSFVVVVNVIVKMGFDSGVLVFEFSIVIIKVGEEVKWVNNKFFFYNIVFVVDGVDVDIVVKFFYKGLVFVVGESFIFIFIEFGIYIYYCEFYWGVGMVGKVVVE